MTAATPLKSVDLTERIGSELMIGRTDLISGAYRDEIRALLIDRGVIVVRGVHLDDSELRTVSRSLGELRMGTAKRGADGMVLKEGDEGILKVSLDEEISPDYAKYLFGNHLWHMDGTYEETPPFATLFMPVRMANQGGDTLFANNYAAYDDLPDSDKALVNTLTVVHTMQAALFPAKRDCTPEEFAMWSTYPQRSHPLVWHHKSGRKSLVLSTSGAYVVGMHAADSHDLLQRLMVHATQEKYIYRHKWQMGDLAMWDNTGLMHRVEPFDPESRREYHRCTLNGEEPVTAVAA